MLLTDLAHGSRKVAIVGLARDHEVDGRLDVASGSSDTASSAHGSATSATNRTGRRGTCACQS